MEETAEELRRCVQTNGCPETRFGLPGCGGLGYGQQDLRMLVQYVVATCAAPCCTPGCTLGSTQTDELGVNPTMLAIRSAT